MADCYGTVRMFHTRGFRRTAEHADPLRSYCRHRAVVEVTPNVAGTVTSIPVEPNVLVKAGTILFQIDPALYQAKVKQLQAAVAEARQKPERLKAQVDAALWLLF